MNHYYYVVASLYELMVDAQKKMITMDEYLDFVEDQLKPNDFDNLKKLFLFNDIRNVISYKEDGHEYLTPSYYSKEEFDENLKDTDDFFSFISQFFYIKESEKRFYPNFNEIDELTILFYNNLELLNNDFIKDYFLFELNLQNITTALTLRRNNMKDDIQNKIIPYGDYFEYILKSNSNDFGLSNDLPFIDRLLEVYEGDDLVKIEKEIEDIRWNWLDERVGIHTFSINAIFAYTVKLNSVERWEKMTDERGREVLNELIGKIRDSIQFPQKFLTIGGK